MNTKLVFAFPGQELLADSITAGIGGEEGQFTLHRFPDGESYVRVLSDVNDREVVVLCTLDRPDTKLLPLFFLCKLLREMKAKSICLVAPYLAYMRQDKKFHSGEAVTSEYFAQLISSLADRLITVDPHLHRHSSMVEIYSIPCRVLHAAGLVAAWLKEHVAHGLLVGPDAESAQWVSAVAEQAGLPFVILQKIRKGDREVEVSIPRIEEFMQHTPVLVDDIISTARTMIETVGHLKKAGMKDPVCIGVHAVFAGHAFEELSLAGTKTIVTCNSIPHPSNRLDISGLIRDSILEK